MHNANPPKIAANRLPLMAPPSIVCDIWCDDDQLDDEQLYDDELYDDE